MNIELIFMILLGTLALVFIGIALHLARINEQLRQRINELERDLAGRTTKRRTI